MRRGATRVGRLGGLPSLSRRQRHLILLQCAVVLFSLSSVLAKLASGQTPESVGFWITYGGMVSTLAVYALIWQQILRYIDLSVAYASKGLSIVWTLAWAVLVFGEEISINNAAGAALIAAGMFLVIRK